MSTLLMGRVKAVMALPAMLLLATNALAGTTQESFEYAVACCWLPYQGECTTPMACANGKPSCESRHFADLDVAFDRRMISSDYYVASLSCQAMYGRGDDSGTVRLFVPPEPARTSDGETLEVGSAFATSLRAATRVLEMQRRGASSEELESTVGDDVDIRVEDADVGERIVTIRGEGADDIVLRFDGNGNVKQESEEK